MRWGQQLCEPGLWCVDGERHSCPAGVYGDTIGEASPTCSGPCLAGHFCPSESVSATQRACGHEGLYCPPGSAAPSDVTPGHYSVQGGPSRRAAQVGRNTCAFSPIVERGDGKAGGPCCNCFVVILLLLVVWVILSGGLPCRQLLCPGGPTAVSPRHMEQRHRYSHRLHIDRGMCTSRLHIDCGSLERHSRGGFRMSNDNLNECPLKLWGIAGLASESGCMPCEAGHYCPEGSTQRRQYPCAAGLFATGGAADAGCDGRCHEGHYCPQGSTEAKQVRDYEKTRHAGVYAAVYPVRFERLCRRLMMVWRLCGGVGGVWGREGVLPRGQRRTHQRLPRYAPSCSKANCPFLLYMSHSMGIPEEVCG